MIKLSVEPVDDVDTLVVVQVQAPGRCMLCEALHRKFLWCSTGHLACADCTDAALLAALARKAGRTA